MTPTGLPNDVVAESADSELSLGRLWGLNGLALMGAALGVSLSCCITLLLHLM